MQISRMHLQLLRIVASGQPISSMGDSFFSTLARDPFPAARTAAEHAARWQATREIGQHISRTDFSSRNLATLVARLVSLLEAHLGIASTDPDAPPPPQSDDQTLEDRAAAVPAVDMVNLVRIVTIFIGHLLAAPHRDVARYFPDLGIVCRLLSALTVAIERIPLEPDTLPFYEDLLELYIFLMSEQMTDPDGAQDASPLLFAALEEIQRPELIAGFFGRLISNLVSGSANVNDRNGSNGDLSGSKSSSTGSLLGAIAGLFITTRPPLDTTRAADLSAYLLSIFAVQRHLLPDWTSVLLTSRDGGPSGSNLHLPAAPGTDEDSLLQISFKRLLNALETRVELPHYAVLLYSLVYGNREFNEYVLAQMDPDRLMLPVLRFLYLASHGGYQPPPIPGTPTTPSAMSASAHRLPTTLQHSHSTLSVSRLALPFQHMYILETLLIQLTHDDAYLDTLSRVHVPSPDWLPESRRAGSPISLASLVALVTIRVTQANLAGERDQFVHTACAAVLANVSRSWRDMHSMVALRLVAWFEIVVKRFARLVAIASGEMVHTGHRSMSVPSTPLMTPQLAVAPGDIGAVPHLLLPPTPHSGQTVGGGASSNGSATPMNSVPSTPMTGLGPGWNPGDPGMMGTLRPPVSRRGSILDTNELNPATDFVIYGELVVLLLEIIASALHPTSLRFNANLVHALLQKQALFTPLEDYDEFAPLALSIHSTLEYFRERIDFKQASSLEAMFSQIGDLSKTVQPTDQLPPVLHFEYCEDVDTPAFFVPFIWRATFLSSPHLTWDPTQLAIFDDPLDNDEEYGLGSEHSHRTTSMGMLAAVTEAISPTRSF
ncbi:Dyggve-Melchior-Clausen syndrome protein-domain-containing protein [Blastocladiella britannica]|nr:Dyggve-Melchior-Clausen syndrome protein-domain-containing protein [Blastocladiella britannica]